MEIVHQILRVIHIGSGITGFFVAPLAMFTKKGGKQHRRWGKIYYWVMIVTTVISVVLAAANRNAFLFGIGVFSFQMVFQGRRALLRKRPDRGQVATPVDWIFSVLSFLAGVGLLVFWDHELSHSCNHFWCDIHSNNDSQLAQAVSTLERASRMVLRSYSRNDDKLHHGINRFQRHKPRFSSYAREMALADSRYRADSFIRYCKIQAKIR